MLHRAAFNVVHVSARIYINVVIDGWALKKYVMHACIAHNHRPVAIPDSSTCTPPAAATPIRPLIGSRIPYFGLLGDSRTPGQPPALGQVAEPYG